MTQELKQVVKNCNYDQVLKEICKGMSDLEV